MLNKNIAIIKKSMGPFLVMLIMISLIGVLPVTASAGAPISNSTIVSSSVPSKMVAGTTYNIKVTFKNTGSEKWTAASGYSLVNAGDSNFKILSGSVLKKSEAIKTNGKKTFTLKVVAPTQAGTYSLKLEMSKGNTTFGAGLEKTITVAPLQMTKITISHAAKKTTYNTLEKLDLTGLVVKGTYNNGTKQTLQITADNISGFDSSAAVKSQKLTISVNGVSTTYKIKIVANALKSISITSMPTKLNYYVGDTLDITGLSVTGKYSNGKTVLLSISPANILGFDTSVPADTQVLTVSVGKVTAQFSISIAQNKANIATAAVAKAESSHLQTDVDSAQALVSALPDGTVKTSLQNRLDAVKAVIALQTAKSAAHTALQTALGGYTESDYSTAKWTTLTAAKSNGDTAIDAATTVSGVNITKGDALTAMAAVKTLAQELADAKTAARNALEAAFGVYKESDYSAANWTTLTSAESNGDTAIDAAASITAVNNAKGDALTAMAAVKTLAQELADAKTAAHTALQTALGGYTESDYSEANWTTLTTARSNGDTAIDAAASITAVNNANGNALSDMAAVKTLAQELADAKTAAHNALETALGEYTESNYSAANWTALNSARSNGDTAIDAAASIPDVNTEESTAETAMDSVETLAQLADAKTDARNALLTALGGYIESNYSEANWTTLTTDRSNGDTAIDAAASISGVNTAKGNALADMNGVKTLKQELAAAKTAAHIKLHAAYDAYDQKLYSMNGTGAILGAENKGDTAIEDATTVDGVNNAEAAAENAMNDVPPRAKDLAGVIEEDCAALSINFEKYKEEDYSLYGYNNLIQIYNAADNTISAAKTVEDADDARDQGLTAMSKVKTIAQE